MYIYTRTQIHTYFSLPALRICITYYIMYVKMENTPILPVAAQKFTLFLEGYL